MQLVSGLAGGHHEPTASNSKKYKEWDGMEWRGLVLADLVRPMLEGLILACFDDAEGIVVTLAHLVAELSIHGRLSQEDQNTNTLNTLELRCGSTVVHRR